MKNYIIAFTAVFGLWIQACSSQHESNKIDVPPTSGVAEHEDPNPQINEAAHGSELLVAPEQREELPPPPPGQPGPDDMERPKLELADIVKEDGKKWKVNKEVISAVGEIDKFVDNFLTKEDHTEREYMDFAMGIRDRQNMVFQSSKVKPPADIHLQEFLMKIDEMVMHIESGEPAMRSRALEVLDEQLSVFPDYFEPGETKS